MAGKNNQQYNLIELLIMISEALLGSLSLTAETVSALSSMAFEKKERQKKNSGKGDWVLRGEDFEKEMKELGDILQANIKYHSPDQNKPEEKMTPEELMAQELRGQMLEEAGQIMNLGPNKGIRTKQEYKKYQQIKEFFLKDNLMFQKKNTKDLQEQKKNLLKNAEKEVPEDQEQKENQPKNAEKEAQDKKELIRLQDEYERGTERLVALTAEKEKDLADRKARDDEQEFQDFMNMEQDDEDEKQQEAAEAQEEDKEEDKKDNFHAAFQGAVKGAAGAVAIGALQKEVKSPYAMDAETMRQQQEVLKNLLQENIKLRTGGLGYVVMNLGNDNMNPEQQMHAKMELDARKFIDQDPADGISDKEAYDAFMDVKNYFLEQNISHVKASMDDNLSRQEAIRSSLQKENEQQRQEDVVDRQKRENDQLAKPEANKNEKEIQHEARKNERKLDERKAEEAKKPEIRKGPRVKPPGIRKEPTNYRELEREVAEEDRLKKNGGKVSNMDRVREQLKKKMEVKKPKLPEEDKLKDPALNVFRKPKI